VHILIVEDDVFYRDLLARMVREWGHAATCAENGNTALRKAARTDFDLLLLDVFLPDMTAMGLIPRLKAFRPDARIITLTGQSSRALERELRELGIAYYMAKPVATRELKSILDHLGRQRAGRIPFSASPPFAVP
jgi:DNA-binding response OmpR family regulator